MQTDNAERPFMRLAKFLISELSAALSILDKEDIIRLKKDLAKLQRRIDALSMR